MRGSAAGLQRLERNEALVRARMLQEVEGGARFLEERARHLLPGVAGMLLNPLAGLALRAAARGEVQRRAQRQLEAVLAAARLQPQSPAAIWDGPFTAYLAHDEAWLRANPRHARFPEVEELVRGVYRARVEAASALLHKGLGESYEDLVRSVFPTRAGAERVLEREFEHAERLLHLAESERGLFHAPPLAGREALRLLRDTWAWYREATRRALDEVYGA